MASVTITVEVRLPMRPNYLTIGGESVDVKDIPDEKLRELAMAWGEALVLHAQTRRAPAEPA